jgi:hypothetical protein
MEFTTEEQQQRERQRLANRERVRRHRAKRRDEQLEKQRCDEGWLFPGEVAPNEDANDIRVEYAFLQCFARAMQVPPPVPGTTYRQQITAILSAWKQAGLPLFNIKTKQLGPPHPNPAFDIDRDWIWLKGADNVIPPEAERPAGFTNYKAELECRKKIADAQRQGEEKRRVDEWLDARRAMLQRSVKPDDSF